MKFDFSNDAMKVLAKTEAKTAGQIIKGIIELPHKGDIKPMEGYSDGRKRLRIGGYRIVYTIIENGRTLHIMDIGPRGDIYK